MQIILSVHAHVYSVLTLFVITKEEPILRNESELDSPKVCFIRC